MTDDEAFIRSLVQTPGDDTLRLVYGDWLEQQGDLRFHYLRAESQAARPATADRTPLAQLAAELDPVWVARVSRPPLGVCCEKVRFRECGPQLTEDDVARVEQRLHVRFPPQFRAFLLNFNGGKPEPSCLPDPNRRPYGPQCLEIGCFFTAYQPAEMPGGQGMTPPYFGIETELEHMRDLHEEGLSDGFPITEMIPFANTVHDLGYLLLGIGARNAGQVFHFRDYCHHTDDRTYLTEYAPTLGDCLSRLIPDPEP